jgi:hypothetical protein
MFFLLGLKQRSDGKPKATWDICNSAKFFKTLGDFMLNLLERFTYLS